MDAHIIYVGQRIINARHVAYAEWVAQTLSLYMIVPTPYPTLQLKGEEAEAVWARLCKLAEQSPEANS